MATLSSAVFPPSGTPRWRRWALPAVLALSLVACGGGGDDPSPPAPPPDTGTPPEPPPELGRLLSAQPLRRFELPELAAALAVPGEKMPALVPRHAVDTYRLTYLTEDKKGALVRASGLVAVPVRAGGAASPVLSYQHATTFHDDRAPSLRLEPDQPPIALAALGYIVVAADYVGFGESHGQEHPYLQSRPSARVVLDMLHAAQAWRTGQGVADTGQLYLAGYSEGGYATMAAQREIERSASPLRAQLRASVPGAGPYDVQVTLDTQLLRLRSEYPALAWALRPGTLRHLGSTVRKELRRLLMRAMVPDDADVAYQTKVLDDYMADDRQAIEQDASVHWGWTPGAPVYLFHGRDDKTVPFEAAQAALQTLSASGGAPVSLRECSQAQPTGHLECVPEYFTYALSVIGQTAAGR